MKCENCGHKIARSSGAYKYLHADRFYENEPEDKELECQKEGCHCKNPEKEMSKEEWERHHQEIKEEVERDRQRLNAH